MKNRSLKSRVAMVAASVIGLTGGVTAISAVPAHATTVCNFKVLSLTSRELQDGDGQDEIKFKLGDNMYGPWNFPDNWTRNNSLGFPNEDYIGHVRFTLYEENWPTKVTIDSHRFGCTTGDNTITLRGAGAIYDLEYRISK